MLVFLFKDLYYILRYGVHCFTKGARKASNLGCKGWVSAKISNMCTKYLLDIRCPSSTLLGIQIIKRKKVFWRIHSIEENYFQWLENSVWGPRRIAWVYFIFPPRYQLTWNSYVWADLGRTKLTFEVEEKNIWKTLEPRRIWQFQGSTEFFYKVGCKEGKIYGPMT